MPYFSGQGRVYIGARDITGKPQGLNYVGNVPELKVSLSVETLEHQESTSGQRLTDLQLIERRYKRKGNARAAQNDYHKIVRWMVRLPAAAERLGKDWRAVTPWEGGRGRFIQMAALKSAG
jgi:hypothetical protein